LEEIAMTVVEYHLKLVLLYWCGAKPDQYTPDSYLRDIWEGRVPQVPYEPEGIKQVFQRLYADPVFLSCPAAHNLQPGEFLKGGDLQTVRQLYMRLLPCGNVPFSPEAGGQLS
jgi:hypothetical protein